MRSTASRHASGFGDLAPVLTEGSKPVTGLGDAAYWYDDGSNSSDPTVMVDESTDTWFMIDDLDPFLVASIEVSPV